MGCQEFTTLREPLAISADCIFVFGGGWGRLEYDEVSTSLNTWIIVFTKTQGRPLGGEN